MTVVMPSPRAPTLALVLTLLLVAFAPLARATGMTAAADPRAVAAGNEMLARGGSATDAAIAAMFVLGLVEPQSAGVGGGGFLMHYDAETRKVSAYDGREWAPAGARPDMFLDAEGKPLPLREAVQSGHSVGTPLLVAMLAMAHEDHGRLPWRDLLQPAIKLADDGFVISERLAFWIAFAAERGGLSQPAARAYLLDAEGKPLPKGTILRNPAYAETLRKIARQGPRALTRGDVARAIVEAAQAGPRGGALALADLRSAKPRRVQPLCGEFRDHTVCSMPPPSSGGVAVLSILGLFERLRPAPEGAASVDDWAAFLWASRLAYSDRDHYVADDAFVPVPTKELIAPAYLDARVRAADLATAAPAAVEPGDPAAILGGESLRQRWGGDPAVRTTGTTHLSVVDADGNAVSLTATVESVFGSQRFAAGFFLNNQLTDFSLSPSRNGLPVANAVAPGKRPRSSMAPALVFEPDGDFYAAVGSPGGSAIIGYVARTIIAMIDWRLEPQAAVDMAHITAARTPARAEMERLPKGVAEGLAARGWELQPTTFEASGLHVVKVGPQALQGGADPRREGVAVAAPPPAPRRGR